MLDLTSFPHMHQPLCFNLHTLFLSPPLIFFFSFYCKALKIILSSYLILTPLSVKAWPRWGHLSLTGVLIKNKTKKRTVSRRVIPIPWKELFVKLNSTFTFSGYLFLLSSFSPRGFYLVVNHLPQPVFFYSTPVACCLGPHSHTSTYCTSPLSNSLFHLNANCRIFSLSLLS